MEMEHWERQQWVAQVAQINQKINEQSNSSDNQPFGRLNMR
jgi:hypothetical protein